MNYDQNTLDAFWYGGTPDAPGSETNILPGAYVIKRQNEIIQLTTVGNPLYDANFTALESYCFTNKLFGWANYVPGAAGNMSYQGQRSGK